MIPWDKIADIGEALFRRLSPRLMFFVLVVSAALFFMPPAWAAYLSLDTWISAHKFWPGLGMVVSIAYLVPFGISPPIERQIKHHRLKGKALQTMAHLATDERAVIRGFYFPVRRGHIMAWPHEIGKLEVDGVLFCPGPSGLKDQMQTYCLTDTASKYIENNPNVFADLEHADIAH